MFRQLVSKYRCSFSNLNKKLNPIKKVENRVGGQVSASLSDNDYLVMKRREQDQYMTRRNEQDNKTMAHFVEHYNSQTVVLELYIDHTCKKCQYVDSLLNYYQVSYKRNQNISYLDNFKYRYREEYKQKVEVWIVYDPSGQY